MPDAYARDNNLRVPGYHSVGQSVAPISTAAGSTTTLRLFLDSLQEEVGGAWTTPAFNAGDFTAITNGSWTVDAGDVATYAYTLVGHKMTVAWYIVSTSVINSGGTPNVLQIKIPGGKTATKAMLTCIYMNDNGTIIAGYASVAAGGTVIQCFLFSSAPLTASVNNTHTIGEITFEVN